MKTFQRVALLLAVVLAASAGTPRPTSDHAPVPQTEAVLHLSQLPAMAQAPALVLLTAEQMSALVGAGLWDDGICQAIANALSATNPGLWGEIYKMCMLVRGAY